MKQVQINTILPKNIRDSKNGLDYTLHGDYYLPDLSRVNTIPFLSDVGGVNTNSTLKATTPACILA